MLSQLLLTFEYFALVRRFSPLFSKFLFRSDFLGEKYLFLSDRLGRAFNFKVDAKFVF